MIESAAFHLQPDLRDGRFVASRPRESGHKRSRFKKVLWLGSAGVRERCERKAINANLSLVVTALLVTGGHQRPIEPFIPINSNLATSSRLVDCGTRMSTILVTARSQFLQRHGDALCVWTECDNKEGMRNRAHAKTRGDKNAQQLSKYPAWRTTALRDL
jgi:hypothetical protein